MGLNGSMAPRVYFVVLESGSHVIPVFERSKKLLAFMEVLLQQI